MIPILVMFMAETLIAFIIDILTFYMVRSC